jgi:Kef-type K+ transport system membrane component KefB
LDANRFLNDTCQRALDIPVGGELIADGGKTNMSPTGGHIENVLLIVIMQLIVIVAAARVSGALFRRIGQPLVCGEIAAGLILGPSFFGGMFPGLFHRIFNPSVGHIFAMMSQIGLIFLMFLIGLEFDFGHLSENRRTALSVSIVGIVLPFSLGLLLGRRMHAVLGLPGSWLNFSLFMAAAMSITAIPILGRIMLELNINRTRIGSLTISAAAADDASGWIILAVITAIARSALNPAKLGGMVLETLGFAAAMVWIVRPLLKKWTAQQMRRHGGRLSLGGLATVLILILVAAAATNLIGIFSIFGAFFLGAILYDQHEFRAAVQERLRDFVTVFFLPIFFTYTGLRTDIGTMAGSTLWVMCGLVLLVAFIGKFGGCWFAARCNGLPWREASIIGVMMNTRALMELIVINIGFELGVIPKSVFFMLVVMAVVSTYITAPVLRRLIRSSEVEQEYLSSEFAGQTGLAGLRREAA